MTDHITDSASTGGEAIGRGIPDEGLTMIHLEVLSRQECILQLRDNGVGRVAVVRGDRPAIYPVNFIVDGDQFIVFRTRRDSDLGVGTLDRHVALEIDGTDAIYHEGWSVLVVGRASHVHDLPEIARLSTAPLTPWAGDGRDCFVKIELDEVSGRHLRHEAPTITVASETRQGRTP